MREDISNIEPDDGHVLTQKIMQLSFAEREKGLYDLHGVAPVIEETNEFVNHKLIELDLELTKIVKHGSALELSMKQSPDYVSRQRIMFLRADQFDTRKAALRMVRFFELKRTIFGASKLSRDITWDDLEDCDKHWLERGSIHLLAQRDRAGRVVICRTGPICFNESMETTVRLCFFVIMTALADEEIGKRGMVFIQYSVGQTTFGMRANRMLEVLVSLPIRWVASHFCYDYPEMHAVVRSIHNEMKKDDLCRFRSHFGSHVECQFNLMTFGISKDVFPVREDGQIMLSFQKEWIKTIQSRSTEWSDQGGDLTTNKKIIVPGVMDILLGRGHHGKRSTGNMKYRDLLETHREVYDAANVLDRKDINFKVLKKLKDSGTRFLRQEGDGWIEISDDAAIDKISHAFRNLRSHVKSSNACRVNAKRVNPFVNSNQS